MQLIRQFKAIAVLPLLSVLASLAAAANVHELAAFSAGNPSLSASLSVVTGQLAERPTSPLLRLDGVAAATAVGPTT